MFFLPPAGLLLARRRLPSRTRRWEMSPLDRLKMLGRELRCRTFSTPFLSLLVRPDFQMLASCRTNGSFSSQKWLSTRNADEPESCVTREARGQRWKVETNSLSDWRGKERAQMTKGTVIKEGSSSHWCWWRMVKLSVMIRVLPQSSSSMFAFATNTNVSLPACFLSPISALSQVQLRGLRYACIE
jgi:hypothetical protein